MSQLTQRLSQMLPGKHNISDMTSLSWQQLFGKLRPLVSGPNSISIHKYKHTITSLLGRYTSDENDFKSYLFYDKGGYTKNLVEDFGDQCNIIVMCWAPGQSSALHGHEGSKCFVKVLSGELLEQQVPYPPENVADDGDCSFVTTEAHLKHDDVTYIDDSIGLHKVINKSIEKPAVTLHIYVPAYKKCRVFTTGDIETGDNKISIRPDQSQSLDVTFHSKTGILQ